MSGTAFEFLRPQWLWALLPVIMLAVLWWRRRRLPSAWESLVDVELQAYVIEPGSPTSSRAPLALFVAWALCVLLLAGPVWEQQDVPVFEAEQAQVVLFDLSRSMLATDVKPDRLTRARFKLEDLLKRSQGVQVALLAFSERPYIISPLTDDVQTIDAFVPSLSPEIMPVQGARIDLAIDRASELLSQANVTAGRLILLTDSDVTARALEAARRVSEQGHQLSIIGVGTARGAPLRGADGRFMQEANGAIVVPQLDMSALRELAQAGGGVSMKLSSDDTDLNAVLDNSASMDILGQRRAGADEADGAPMQQSWWIERGPWLLPVLALAALFLFRRGVIA